MQSTEADASGMRPYNIASPVLADCVSEDVGTHPRCVRLETLAMLKERPVSEAHRSYKIHIKGM